jgi:hypothetical protein
MTLELTPLEADPLRESVLLSQARRQERQAKKLRLQRERQRPTYLAGNGTVKPLGADGPIRLRGNFLAGGVPIGGPVAVSQGLGMSQPAIGGLDFDASDLEAAIRQIRQAMGAQYTTASDPNDPAISPRHPADIIVTESDGTWVWYPATSQWRQGAGGAGGIGIARHPDDPNGLGQGPGLQPIVGLAEDTLRGRLFYANADGTSWIPVAPRSTSFGVDPGSALYPGDISHSTDNTIYLWDGSFWVSQSWENSYPPNDPGFST